MTSLGNANSRAAADWAAKRRLQLERAAQLKAERQATLRSQRESGQGGLETGEGAMAPMHAPAADGPRRTFSQPASDQLQGPNHLQANLPLRPNTEAGDSSDLPEWARDFSTSRADREELSTAHALRRWRSSKA